MKMTDAAQCRCLDIRMEVEIGATTVLDSRDTPPGTLSESAARGPEQGWRCLLVDMFKPYAEEGVRPERPASVLPA